MQSTGSFEKSGVSIAETQIGHEYTTIGRYHGTTVALKYVKGVNVKVDRSLLQDMSVVSD